MKLKRAVIESFKGIKDLEIDFADAAGTSARPLTCLIGDNGSGKTTALQAIALVLSLATRRTPKVALFKWHGFLPERVSSLGQARVELTIALDADEVRLTSELFAEWHDSRSAEWLQTHQIIPPGIEREIVLIYERGRVTANTGMEGVNQFLGRYYIKQMRHTQPSRRELFSNLGDVFWFDQYRNLGTTSNGRDDTPGETKTETSNWNAGVERLREFLVGMWSYHVSPNKNFGQDYIAKLETMFANIFPNTKFRGTAPRENIGTGTASDFYFLLERDGKVYDLAETSSGEQAVFPLLYEFVRLGISKSIVLIDELELHLHPPQQQALLAALKELGSDCQFIITTHSPYLTDAIPDEQEVRLKGGRRCL